MAKHLSASQKEKKKQASRRKRNTPPRLLQWKAPEPRVFRYQRAFTRQEILPVLVSLLLFAASLAVPYGVFRLVAFAVTAVVAAFPVLKRTAVSILNLKWPDEDSLVIPAALFCFLAGHYASGALAVILGRIPVFVQAYVLARSERGVEALGDILPEKAHRVLEYGTEDLVPEELREGDCFVVYPGEAIPVDGEVLAGESTVDSSMFGGPETPWQVGPGSRILSGTVNVSDTLRLKAVHSFEESGLTRHIQTLMSAGQDKTVLEERQERIASFVAPALLLLALVVGVIVPLVSGNWESGLSKAAVFFCLASPASLVLAAPVASLGGMSCASHSGMRLRSKLVLERLAHLRTIVFGKTGTITDGDYHVTEVFATRVSEEELLRVAAAAESFSRHPIALAIREAAGWSPENGTTVLEGEEIPGRGVSSFVDGNQVYVGNAALLEEHGIWFQIPNRSGAAVHVAVNNVYWGHILMNDKIREGAFDAVEELRSQGMKSIVMLTGDVRSVTSKIARSLSFDMVKTELSPEDKISAVDFLRRSLGREECLACVGDGFHDAALFERADVGIALNAMGDDTAEQAADVVLMDDELERIPDAVRIARGTDLLIKESAVVLGAVKLLLLLLTLLGGITIIPAVAINAVAECLAALNALRAFTLI